MPRWTRDVPCFAVDAHLRSLFDTPADEPGDEEEQQKGQDELAGRDAPLPLPVPLSLRAYEELAQRNEARHDWTEQGGKPDREIIRGTYRRMAGDDVRFQHRRWLRSLLLMGRQMSPQDMTC